MIKKEFFYPYNIAQNSAFIDMECNGFSPYKNDIIVISIAKFFDEDKIKIVQLISQNDEKSLILEFLTNIIGIYEIYSFNGYEFEEKFIQSKIKKYALNFDFSHINFISLKKILKNYAKFINLDNFSKNHIQDFFEIERKQNYDMKSIINSLKDTDISSNIELLDHNIDEILSLIQIYNRIFEFQYEHRFLINDYIYYLYDFDIKYDFVSLLFKSEKKYKNSNFFMEDGEKLSLYNYNINLQIMTKSLYEKEDKIILYETYDKYVPIFIKNDILYENIAFILQIYEMYL